MPDKEFLEEYPLYRKFKIKLSQNASELKLPALNFYCPACKSEQTYTSIYGPSTLPIQENQISIIKYQCSSCIFQTREYWVLFNFQKGYVQKVGQNPPWDTSVSKSLRKALTDNFDFYQKGLVCESQSYGIGAISYYRRVVQEIIDDLLDKIKNLMSDEEKNLYLDGLEKVKESNIAAEKIKLVKDLIPSILKPDGMNPLDVLYENLSEGLHDLSDEDCLERAAKVRNSLEFLILQIAETRKLASKFTSGMHDLLRKKN